MYETLIKGLPRRLQRYYSEANPCVTLEAVQPAADGGS